MRYVKFLLPLLLIVGLMIGCAQKPPTITKVEPATASSSGGTEITITGTGFKANPAPTVTVGGSPATGVKVVSKTSLKATVPAGVAGPASIVVQNAKAKVKSAPFANFSYYDDVAVTATNPDPMTAPAEGIDAPAKIDITFNQDVDPATVMVKVTDAEGNEVAGAVAQDATDTKMFSFTPGSAMKAGTYNVTVSGATSTTSMVAMPADHTFSFTVKEAPAKGKKK
jgi:methionine-rich copper-binding protein CopC